MVLSIVFLVFVIASSKRSVNCSDTLPDISAATLALKFSPIFRAIIFARLVAPCLLQLFAPFIRLANKSTFFSIVPRFLYSIPSGGKGSSTSALFL